MMNFNEQYKYYVDVFEKFLSESIALHFNDNSVVSRAVKYSVIEGGKRIRPVLCFATADLLNIQLQDVSTYALAVEYIHTYSLIHDDLPCMDNDDYRRGKLSTHKKFGENIGVLAGDALLTKALSLPFYKENFTYNDVLASKLLGDFAGHRGMIYGQELDLLNETSLVLDENILNDILLNKTAKLITLPMLICSTLCNNKFFDELMEFGNKLGLIFQITDDILDVEGSFKTIGKTPKKDDKAQKLTSIKVYGLDGAKEKAKQYFDECNLILSKISGSEFLIKLTEKIFYRKA